MALSPNCRLDKQVPLDVKLKHDFTTYIIFFMVLELSNWKEIT
jgi:hypothetical protein